jgi:hypothetical protein
VVLECSQELWYALALTAFNMFLQMHESVQCDNLSGLVVGARLPLLFRWTVACNRACSVIAGTRVQVSAHCTRNKFWIYMSRTSWWNNLSVHDLTYLGTLLSTCSLVLESPAPEPANVLHSRRLGTICMIYNTSSIMQIFLPSTLW